MYYNIIFTIFFLQIVDCVNLRFRNDTIQQTYVNKVTSFFNIFTKFFVMNKNITNNTVSFNETNINSNYTSIQTVDEYKLNNSTNSTISNSTFYEYDNNGEGVICPKYEDYKTLLAFQFQIDIENKNNYDSVFKYEIYGDYGCKYYESAGTNPGKASLKIPVSIGEIFQKGQHIKIFRFYDTPIDNSTLKIYNPKNSLKFKSIFETYISNDTLYIYPWVKAETDIFGENKSLIKINQNNENTEIYIPKMGIHKIDIVFSDLYRLFTIESIINFLSEEKTKLNFVSRNITDL